MFAQPRLRCWKLDRTNRSHIVPRTPARRTNFRPHLEAMEDRTLLAFGFGAAFSVGGPGLDYAHSIAKDASGNTYLSGAFEGPGVNFNPYGLPVFLSGGGQSAFQTDGFVAMYRPDMTLAWATDLGPAEGAELAVQGSNIYVVCAAWSAAYSGPYTMLASRLNAADGTLQWTTSLASGATSSYRDVAVGPSGNIYVSGSNGSSQAFVSKLNPLGGILWTQTTTGGTAVSTGIAVDSAENVFATGGYTGSVSFGSGHTLASTSATQDAYAWKLNSNGSTVWAGSMGSIGDDIGYGITVDSGGDAILTGGWGYSQTASTGKVSANNDFDPGSGVLKLTSNGGYDVFIVKLAPNADGSMKLAWAKDIGGPNTTAGSFDWAKGVTTDGAGNVYTTGSFGDSVDFDPGKGTYILPSAGGRDIFVSKLDANGNFVAAAAMGGTVYDDGASIALDSSGNVWTTGGFRGTADFDPTAGTYYLTQNGYPANQIYDLFVSKLTQSGLLQAPAAAPPAGGTQRLSLSLLQASQPANQPPLSSPKQVNRAGSSGAGNSAVVAGGAPGVQTGAVARDQFFSKLSRGGVKEKVTDLAVIAVGEGMGH